MHLDEDDEKILNGEYGETRQKMMEILVALGKVYDADRLIPVTSAQVSGASYKTIGRWGLSWLKELDARAVIPAVLNPIGMPREEWRDIGGITQEFAEKQREVLEAYHHLGIRPECTCTPYYLNRTEYGEHLAWSESSAVVYANSVIGARTNREGGPSALAAAIIGKTPNYGLHLVKNRAPQIMIDLAGSDDGNSPFHHYGALGYIAGKKAGNLIAFFRGIRPNRDQLKAMGAAMGATGAAALFHVEGITPESRVFDFETEGLRHVTIEGDEVAALFEDIDADAVAIGCPHCSPRELHDIAGLLEGRKTTKPLFIFAARGVMRAHNRLIAQIERSGARVYPDTCMVVSPAMERFSTIMVNSGKAFSYIPNMCGAKARIGTLEECIQVATS